jgi:hypothetical protein
MDRARQSLWWRKPRRRPNLDGRFFLLSISPDRADAEAPVTQGVSGMTIPGYIKISMRGWTSPIPAVPGSSATAAGPGFPSLGFKEVWTFEIRDRAAIPLTGHCPILPIGHSNKISMLQHYHSRIREVLGPRGKGRVRFGETKGRPLILTSVAIEVLPVGIAGAYGAATNLSPCVRAPLLACMTRASQQTVPVPAKTFARIVRRARAPSSKPSVPY